MQRQRYKVLRHLLSSGSKLPPAEAGFMLLLLLLHR
jgi:hypothetical protein